MVNQDPEAYLFSHNANILSNTLVYLLGKKKKRNDSENGMTERKNMIFPNMLIYSDKLTRGQFGRKEYCRIIQTYITNLVDDSSHGKSKNSKSVQPILLHIQKVLNLR